MAKQKTDNQQFSVEDKIKHYSGRVNDSKLSEGQRKHAERRLKQLCGGGHAPARTTPPSSARATQAPLTPQQQNARMAGIGFGTAKEGGRVPVQPENQQSFRDGVQEGKALAKKQNQPF